MKILKTHALACLAAVCFLVNMVSCSSAIPLQIAVPAKYNLRRGSSLKINYEGRFADRVTDKFIDIVRSEGYYSIAPRGQVGNYILGWQSIYDQYGNPLGAYFSIRQTGGQELGAFRATAGLFNFSPEETVARMCYNAIAPHEETLKIFPKPKTQELEKAVEMCKLGQWDEAKNYLQEAMTKYPDDPENYYLQAIVNVKELNYDAADDLLHKAYRMKQDKRYLQAIKNNAAMRHNDEAVKRQLSEE